MEFTDRRIEGLLVCEPDGILRALNGHGRHAEASLAERRLIHLLPLEGQDTAAGVRMRLAERPAVQGEESTVI